MEAILASLIAQLKNPWQYICVGIVWSGILYFDIDKQYIIPFIIISLGVAYLLEYMLTKIVVPIFGIIKKYIFNKYLLYVLKGCSFEEKDFLYNRVYKNGNELKIDINKDIYFYKLDETTYEGKFCLYKKNFNTKEKILKFLRKLESKKIIENYSSQSMIIPVSVWNVLVKNADSIFEDFKYSKEN